MSEINKKQVRIKLNATDMGKLINDVYSENVNDLKSENIEQAIKLSITEGVLATRRFLLDIEY